MLSLQTSQAEMQCESSTQLLLLIHIWLSGGHMYLSPMISSLIIIGKVSVENYFTKELEGKTFLEKLKIIAYYLPMFASTVVFRITSGALGIYHPGSRIIHSTLFRLL